MSASRWLAEPLLAADVEHSSSILTQFQQTISLACRETPERMFELKTDQKQIINLLTHSLRH